MSDEEPRYGLFQSLLPPLTPYDPPDFERFNDSLDSALSQIGKMVNSYSPQPSEQGYVGNRCGWYPEKPRRRRKSRP